jgi:hypothetical protein
MEDKYSPLHVVSHVWGKFWAFPEHQNSAIEDYSIFIEDKHSENDCFQIRVTKNGCLWKGIRLGTAWRAIKDEEELYKNREFLGAVHITFRNDPIKMNDKVLEPFPNYDFFWSYITR